MIIIILVLLILFLLFKTPSVDKEAFVFMDNRLINKNHIRHFHQTVNNSQLSALSRGDLQTPPGVDINKIDFTKLTNQEYTDLIMKLQQTNERPIIKNLPVF
jgi:hypothetical protein